MENPVQELMEEKNLARSQFVDMLRYKVSQSSIYGWIDGSHVPTSGNVHLILNQFDFTEQERLEWRLKFKRWGLQKRKSH